MPTPPLSDAFDSSDAHGLNSEQSQYEIDCILTEGTLDSAQQQLLDDVKNYDASKQLDSVAVVKLARHFQKYFWLRLFCGHNITQFCSSPA